jgi:hypothetical protein
LGAKGRPLRAKGVEYNLLSHRGIRDDPIGFQNPDFVDGATS